MKRSNVPIKSRPPLGRGGRNIGINISIIISVAMAKQKIVIVILFGSRPLIFERTSVLFGYL